jgi:hypothetical protein
MDKKRDANRYSQLIEMVFFEHYREGMTEFEFERAEIEAAAANLGIVLPKNIGDVLYSFRYRVPLPRKIAQTAPEGSEWTIQPAGRGRYRWQLTACRLIVPSPMLAETKIPDATPGVISMYALNDEQALLAKLRYNRLIDIFTGLTCYSLQNHLRTTVTGMGQVETDEIYIGLDKRGAHYILPVQAKSRRDKIGSIQIEQDFAMCASKWPALICRAIAAQTMDNDLIALFELEKTRTGIAVSSEKHYRLVPPDQVSSGDLQSYQTRQP